MVLPALPMNRPTLAGLLRPVPLHRLCRAPLFLDGRPQRLRDFYNGRRFARLLRRVGGTAGVDGPRVLPFRRRRWRPDLTGDVARRGWAGLRRLRALTIRLTHVHHDDAALAAFARAARRALRRRRVGINAYYSTPASGIAVPFHKDGGDLFVFQIDGRKIWSIRWRGRVRTHALEAGDVLYVPEGVAHRAETPKDAYSLHLTLQANRNRSRLLSPKRAKR